MPRLRARARIRLKCVHPIPKMRVATSKRRPRTHRFRKGLMRTTVVVLFFLLCSSLTAENLEKTQKKELEMQVKAMTAEAEALAKAGHLAEARVKYAESQSLIEVKDVTEAIKHLDEEIHKQVKDALSDSRKLYDSRKFKEAAGRLDEGMKLGALQPLLSYNLALCYYELGDRTKALEYLNKSKAGTANPKQRERVSQLLTFIQTGENGGPAKRSDQDRIAGVNRLSESVGMEAFLEDEAGEEDSTPSSASAEQPPTQALALQTSLKPIAPSSSHSNATVNHR